jgi:ribonuclease HI
MAMGAWVGWIGRDTDRCPVVTGTAFLGSREGPNKAEYRALIAGFSESLEFVQTCEAASRPEAVVVHTDNEQVAATLTGRYGVDKLKELRMVAREIQGGFEHIDVEVHYEQVGGGVPGLRRADELSKRAFDQLLIPEWRPAGRATARLAAKRPGGKARMWTSAGYRERAAQHGPR